MKRASLLAALAAIVFLSRPAILRATATASNENALVYAPTQDVADQVLQKADEYRRQMALEWLGEELPPSVGRMRIHVELVDETSGLTWPIGDTGKRFHTLWVNGNLEAVTGGLLRHEVTHAVLATAFPEGLPPAIDEGIAAMADDAKRDAIRRRILDWHRQSGNWPRLKALLEMRVIPSEDQQSYAVASSLVEYLLTLRDRTTLLRFARSGKANGWDQAVRMHYKIASVEALESQWKDWASRQKDAPGSVALRAAAVR
jgi:hypothetical protein